MPTCKECLYYEPCSVLNAEFKKHPKDFIETDLCAKQCTTFKDRSRFVELPIKPGEKVFYFDTAGRIYESTVTQLVYGATGFLIDAEQALFLIDSDVMFNSNLIGERFFLTREEAEQALKEREGETNGQTDGSEDDIRGAKDSG